ncbi:Myblike DNAbinding domain-containing protein [Actinomortierella wolfii]|nr:Myblike DNAbinding domain-containing protein [Actinomortierella wolfii]
MPALDPQYGWNAHKDGMILYRRLVLGNSWQEIGKLVNLDPIVCMARFKVVLEPVLAKSPGAGALEESSVFQAVMQEWQWQPVELQRWYQQRVEVVGFVNTKLSEEFRWTQAMENQLWKMHQQGYDWSAIATALEMSEESCLRRFKLRFLDKADLDPATVKKVVGIGRPSRAIWTPELDEQVIRLRKLGLTWREIGSKLQISHVSCRKRYEAILWPKATQYWNDERSATLAEYLRQGRDLDEISEAMGDEIHPMAIDRQARAVLKQVQKERRQKEKEVLKLQRAYSSGEKEKWEESGGNELSPASLEQYFSEEDWNRLLSDDETISKSNMSRQQQKESWRNIHGCWTIEQETTLIQQVLRRGLGDYDHWKEIASVVGGGHSPEACRIRWKNLDMPVKQAASIPTGWSLVREQNFWRIWREQRPDICWDRIAQELGENVTAQECEQYFDYMSAPFRSKSIPRHLFQKLLEERLDRLSESMARKGGVLFWTKPRSTQLQTLARIFYGPHWWRRRRILWRKVAKQMGSGVTRLQCHQHWSYLKPIFRATWTRDEVKLLEKGVRIYGEDWPAIRHAFLPHRTVSALRRKWLIISDHGAKLTVDEYMTLLTSIQAACKQSGSSTEIDWVRIASQLPGWAPAPCRRVWESSYLYLLQNTEFSAEEDHWLVLNMDPAAPQDWEAVPQQLDSTKSPWLYRLRWCQLMMPRGSTNSLKDV